MKKIDAISGSLRKNSYNTLCLKEIKNLIGKETEMEILDISAIPLFNEDLKQNNFPAVVKELNEKLRNADLILIATPEYNYSVSGVLKNALDWFSRGDNPVFEGKKVAIISASISRFGGVRAQNHLRQILFCMDAGLINHPEVFISSAHTLFKNNILIDQHTKEILQNFTQYVITNI